MSSLKDKERAKEQQEKFQAILSALLKDEDNKYCVDCDAKGPRWASWNLGIFLCIRCAGIHRNLGVHISKVKSVNLDTWTAEQVAMMQEIGNSRGRAVYEANIPDGFRRPQTDSALEAFIRSKYEHKKYIAREWVPPKPTVPKEWLEDSKAEKKRARASKQAGSGGVQLPSIPKVSEKSSSESTKPAAVNKPEPVKAAPAQPTASNDLLGLETTAPAPTQNNELLNLFGGPQPAAPAQPQTSSASNDLIGIPHTNGTSAAPTSESGNLFGSENTNGGTGEEEKKTSAKDSIMALFGGLGGGGMAQPQMYGVPGSGYPYYYNYQLNGGVYMPQGQQMYSNQGMMGQPQNMMGQPQNMMGQQQNMMGQPQNMMGQPQNLMGQPQGMMGQQQGMFGQPQGMMGQPQGMMGQPQGSMGQPQNMMGQPGAMNGGQTGMFNGQNPMMGGAAPGNMYNPQQMQQLQFQQMQQQMTNMKLGSAQMGTMPQQAVPGAGMGNNWGAAQGTGHTLSTNLWQ